MPRWLSYFCQYSLEAGPALPAHSSRPEFPEGESTNGHSAALNQCLKRWCLNSPASVSLEDTPLRHMVFYLRWEFLVGWSSCYPQWEVAWSYTPYWLRCLAFPSVLTFQLPYWNFLESPPTYTTFSGSFYGGTKTKTVAFFSKWRNQGAEKISEVLMAQLVTDESTSSGT